MAASTQVLELERIHPQQGRLPGLLRMARRKYMGTASALVIVVFVFVAFSASYITPHDPLAVHTSVALRAPSSHYLLGTDELGRDLLSRLIYGARISLLVGFSSVAIGTAIGVFLGLTSGYFGGSYDMTVQRFIDALQAFPALVLAMVMVATLGPSLRNVVLAISIIGIASRARVVRGTALSLMQNSYIDAARAIGCSVGQIVKSLVFTAAGRPVVALVSGANRLDPERLAAVAGAGTAKADAEVAHAATGYAIGGVPPETLVIWTDPLNPVGSIASVAWE